VVGNLILTSNEMCCRLLNKGSRPRLHSWCMQLEMEGGKGAVKNMAQRPITIAREQKNTGKSYSAGTAHERT
jgi:hypothetical protein